MRPLAVLLLVLIAIALFAFAMLRTGEETPPQAGPGAAPAPTAEAPPPVPALEASETRRVEEVEPVSARTEAGPNVAGGYSNSLSGQVVDPEGQPVRGAEVLLSKKPMMGEYLAEIFFSPPDEREAEQPEEAPLSSRTAEDGRYTFRSIEPRNNYYLIVSHAEYSQVQEASIRVGEEGEHRGPDIMLRPGPILRGTVTDETGAPISGAEVHTDSAYMLGVEVASPDRLTAQTDGLGSYEIRNVPAGPRNVLARADGFGLEIKHNIMFKDEVGEEVTVDFALDVGLPLGGRVIGPDGYGLADITVLALHYGNNSSSRGQTLTDENGEFMIQGLQTGPYMVRCEGTGYRQESGPGGRSKAGDMDVVLKMTVQAAIKGRVVDESGAPVQNFQAQVQYVDETQTIYENTDVRARFKGSKDGSFVLTGLDPGMYVIQVRAKGYAPTTSSVFNVTRTDRNLSGLSIRLSKGGSIGGLVVDSEGNPIKGALITTHDNAHVDNAFNDLLGDLLQSNVTKAKARTDASGRFKLPLLTPETYQIHVQHTRFTKHIQKEVVVRASKTNDVGSIKLLAGGTIRGTVRDETGKVLARAHLVLNGNDGIASYTARSNNQGQYEFLHVRAGTYKLSATRVGPGTGGDVFAAIADQKASEVSISVYDGSEVTQDLNLGE